MCRRLGRDSELYKSLNPDDDVTWGVAEYLLAQLADSAAARLWQAAGGKGRKPKPIPRPGDVKTYRGDSMPVQDMADWLGWDVSVPAPDLLDRGNRDDAIRAALAGGEKRRAIAERFGVSVSTVGRIARASIAV